MVSLMTAEEIEDFFKNLSALDPHPQGELHSRNAFTFLVAVVLSAQSTDKGVNRATKILFEVADTPQKLLSLGEERLKTYINTLGLYNGKARHLIALSQRLIDAFGGEVPATLEALLSLPGVGRKTANVVLNALQGLPVIAVDTHVFRVANRTGLSHGTTPQKVEKDLMKRIPPRWLGHAHHWLVLHGRYLCKARGPSCPSCPVQQQCHYPHKTQVSL